MNSQKHFILLFTLILFIQSKLFAQELIEMNEMRTECTTDRHLHAVKLNQAFNWMQKGNLRRSIEYAEKVIKIDSLSCDAYNIIAMSYYIANMYDESIENCIKSLQLNPDNYTAILIKGNSQLELKQYESAIESYNLANRIKPNYHEAIYNLGLAYYYIKNYKKVIETLNQVELLKTDETPPKFLRRVYELKELAQKE